MKPDGRRTQLKRHGKTCLQEKLELEERLVSVEHWINQLSILLIRPTSIWRSTENLKLLASMSTFMVDDLLQKQY